ncbi:hypothetical protein V2J09_022467 [Rumex salicifolius]
MVLLPERTEEQTNSLPLEVGGLSPHQKSEPPEEMPETKDERSPSDDGPGSPRGHRWRSRSRSKSKSKSPRARLRSRSPPKSRRSRSRSPEASNPGNNLYVTGLSTRVTSADLKKYFAKEGKVTECNLVTDPRSKESRGFAFITMDSTEDADRCVKYLNRTVLEGRLITVEKALNTFSTSETGTDMDVYFLLLIPNALRWQKEVVEGLQLQEDIRASKRNMVKEDGGILAAIHLAVIMIKILLTEETGELQDLDPHPGGGQIIQNPTEGVMGSEESKRERSFLDGPQSQCVARDIL